ncbi:mevalonate kinase, partial [Mytilus galloprovincialis]
DLIDMNHDLLRFLGVSHPSLESVCKTCQQYGLHCKLTGAGGGGCAFCLISPETTEEILQTVEIELKKQNFECWETSVGGNGVMCHDPACGTTSSIPDFLKTT